MIPNILNQLEANIRTVGRQERTVITQAHFEIFISPRRLDHLSFAIPLPEAPRQWATAVTEMQATFAQHNKRARLEYIADLHPDLAPALEQAGLVCESRAPVMALDMANLSPPPALPLPATYHPLRPNDEALLRTYLRHQSLAYGGTGAAEAMDWLPNLQNGLANRSVLGAYLLQDDEMVSGAVIQIGAGIGELAGVWSASTQRKRGLAFALCQQLLAEYTAVGYSHCWLSAAEGAQRLYEKLGFVTVGTQLNYGAALPIHPT